MTDTEMEAIAGGYHGDPFRILGPHRVEEDRSADSWEIRSFLPHAAQASVVNSTGTFAMERVHPHGLYVAKLSGKPSHYRLRINKYSGETIEVEDPYRFPTLLTDFDLHIFGEGTHYEAYRTLGAHLQTVEGVAGTRFAVWAPNALIVSVVGDFNGWDSRVHPMRARTGGIWELFIPGLATGTPYKYAVKSRFHGYFQMKADPYGFGTEVPPNSASVVVDIHDYQWQDQEWLQHRADTNLLDSALSVYEVHTGSWLKHEDGTALNYRELANKLVPYVKDLGYTHIELMPPMEHPYAGSWGYQVIGYFAPTARFGEPQEFMYFVDQCHQAGIGVIVDWVPGHFPKDAHGLAYFDGTALYEHADPRLGEHKDWGTLIFNYGRNEVRSFLISNAMFWLEQFHIDGLRVDAVASMLYLDYSRKPGEWIPNQYGGNENIEAIEFLRKFNHLTHTKFPGVMTIAEESTAWPQVTKPPYLGGLGFSFKWNMGWMHDTLGYFSRQPVHRKYHQNDLTFAMLYHHHENFILPLSHDEVVHGKGSLLGRMPGDDWQRFANLRILLGYQWSFPGKKLLFMGGEFGQSTEWNANGELDWWLLEAGPYHRGLLRFVEDLNKLYLAEAALWRSDYDGGGFYWIDCADHESSVLSFGRRDLEGAGELVVMLNLTPVPRYQYRVGLPRA